MADTIAKYIQGVGTLLIGLSLIIGVIWFGYFLIGNIQDRTITVTGKARKSLIMNESTVSGTWEKKEIISDKAREAVRELSSKALTAIKAAGIDEKKITTTSVSVYPEYDWSGKENKITGYRALTTLQVKLTDPKKADLIISLMTKNKASSTSGPQLGFSNAILDQMEKELKNQAVNDAKNQADTLAQQAGARLGKVVSISGGGISTPSNGGVYPLTMSKAEVASDSSTPSDISIGEEEMTATVTVTYRLK